MVRRGISLRSFEVKKSEFGAKGAYRQFVEIKQGVTIEKAREIVKLLKDAKFKV